MRGAVTHTGTWVRFDEASMTAYSVRGPSVSASGAGPGAAAMPHPEPAVRDYING